MVLGSSTFPTLLTSLPSLSRCGTSMSLRRWGSLCDTSRGVLPISLARLGGVAPISHFLRLDSTALPAYVHEGKEPEAPKVSGLKRTKTKVRISPFRLRRAVPFAPARGVLTRFPPSLDMTSLGDVTRSLSLSPHFFCSAGRGSVKWRQVSQSRCSCSHGCVCSRS